MADELERPEQPERRAWPRTLKVERSDMARGRLSPGRAAQILDVSQGGALVETDWREGTGGPSRKYYRLSPDGLRTLRDTAADWSLFAARVTALMEVAAP